MNPKSEKLSRIHLNFSIPLCPRHVYLLQPVFPRLIVHAEALLFDVPQLGRVKCSAYAINPRSMTLASN
jgi:hypothetical protein